VRTRQKALSAVGVATGAILAVALSTPAFASSTVTSGGPDGHGNGYGHGGNDKNSSATLRKAVTAKGIERHLQALQEIADANGGTRAAGTPGYEASGAYVERQLQRAGYNVERQPFSYDKVNIDRAEFGQVTPDPVSYTLDDQFAPMDYSGEGDVQDTALTAVDVNLEGDRASTSGCEAEDFTDFPAGNVALIQRGTCSFADKAANAEAAGASGVVIFNQGNDVPGDDRFGVLFGTLGELGRTIPVIGTSFEIGETLAVAIDPTVDIVLETTTVTIDTFNVIGTSKKGDSTHQIVIGSHLDSVPAGPGINDNGTGSASDLEIAIQLAKTKSTPGNQLVFAFWGGEEDGLQGSNYYVSQLTDAELANTAANLNFDMVGSPNSVNFVYDGNGDAFGEAGPDGSDDIEALFESYFASQGIPTAPTAFDGRTDYYGFINAGIPAGGLFTGAEGIKTPEEATIFGGTAGEPYDPCYHQACDTIDNVDPVVLGKMADGIAHAVFTLGEVTTKWGGWGHGHHNHGWGNGHGWGDKGSNWGDHGWSGWDKGGKHGGR